MSKRGFMCGLFPGLPWCKEPPPEPEPEPKPPPGDSSMLELHNRARLEQGITTVLLEVDALAKEAQDWANRMVCSHAAFPQNLYRAGYQVGGENVACGYPGEASAFDGWMNSPGHRKNILNSDWNHVGFGDAGGYFVALFGRGGIVERSVMMSFDIADHVPPPLRNES